MKIVRWEGDLLIRPESEEETEFLKKRFVYGDRYITWNFNVGTQEFAGLQIYGDDRPQKKLVFSPLEKVPEVQNGPA